MTCCPSLRPFLREKQARVNDADVPTGACAVRGSAAFRDETSGLGEPPTPFFGPFRAARSLVKLHEQLEGLDGLVMIRAVAGNVSLVAIERESLGLLDLAQVQEVVDRAVHRDERVRMILSEHSQETGQRLAEQAFCPVVALGGRAVYIRFIPIRIGYRTRAA